MKANLYHDFGPDGTNEVMVFLQMLMRDLLFRFYKEVVVHKGIGLLELNIQLLDQMVKEL